MKAFKLPSGVTKEGLAKAAQRTRGKTSKAKGANYEKLVAQMIAKWIDLPVTDVFRTRTGPDKEDIGLSSEAIRRFPFSVECKHHKTLKIPEWLRQAEVAAAKNGLTPIVVFKQWSGQPGDKARNFVVIDFLHFMELIYGTKMPH